MKIAIIGSGISGLGLAYLLDPYHEITIYEKNDYIGGHSRTIDVKIGENKIPVDTGFIVFNKKNYPHLTNLFKQLAVPIIKSDMSFGVSIKNGWLEYGTKESFDIFAQKRNLFRIDFWQMLFDILKFNKNAKEYLESDISLGECLRELNMREWFIKYYLLAMGASIWSTPVEGMLNFPARTFIRFFDNHGLLTINDQPQWHTVKGGSKEYVKRILANIKANVKTNCAVKKVSRKAKNIEILDINNNKEKYDQVIFACHSDQTLNLLEKPGKDESEILGSINYQKNQMVMHSDISFMQKREKAWSSWVYLSEETDDKNNQVSLSYWMNNLQDLKTKDPIIVTLNPSRMPKEGLIYDQYTFEHPVFDQNAIKAQSKIDQIQGADRIWYAGAWQRYGFHEDGLLSAINIAEKLGATIPWK